MITESSIAPKRFLHYYFYVLDPFKGPMSLCVASYLPCSVNCFMNGHSYVAGELRRAGVAFRMEDNAIVRPLTGVYDIDGLTPASKPESCRRPAAVGD